MAAPTIRDLPEAPARTMGPDEFSNKADAFLAELQPWGQEVESTGSYVETRAGEAVTARDEAEAARDAVFADAGIYSSTTEGLNNSSDGQHFQVINTSEIAIYRNDSGSATQITTYPATDAFGTAAFKNEGAGSGLNADTLDGKQSGNASGNIPVSNGTRNANLNADLLDGTEGSGYLKKSEFDPDSATSVWSGFASSVNISSLSKGGPGLYSFEWQYPDDSSARHIELFVSELGVHTSNSALDASYEWYVRMDSNNDFSIFAYNRNGSAIGQQDIYQIFKYG